MENVLKIGKEIFVNGKWYFDVYEIKQDEQELKVRIKYYDDNTRKNYTYKIITLPILLFDIKNELNNVIYASVDVVKLKKIIGSLINRLVKEPDLTKLFEDGGAMAGGGNTAGMGAVSNPGMSGVAGVPGTAGSGDISSTVFGGSVLPANSFGLEIDRKPNKRIRKKLYKKNNGVLIKKPVILLTKENVDTEITDNDYKRTLYDFLDYPTDNEIDIKFLDVINDLRPQFLELSVQRIIAYFKKLYEVNKSLITSKTSDWFQNNMLILGNIEN